MDTYIRLDRPQPHVAHLILNRPDKSNAFDDEMIAALTAAIKQISTDANVHIVVLEGEGKHFSAGADLNWMQRMATASVEDNQKDALKLADLLYRLNHLTKPTVAIVRGAAMGGGVGLLACCDIVIAAESAQFALSEVKLGLIPAVISPYVLAAMGERAARRYFLSGERFSVHEAKLLGLVHHITLEAELDDNRDRMVTILLQNGPKAMVAAKQLIADIKDRPIDNRLSEDTATRIAKLRASTEAQIGMNAFFNKKAPEWNEEEKA
jgi:methylglutaconyl-CoA hydratase